MGCIAAGSSALAARRINTGGAASARTLHQGYFKPAVS